MTNEIYAQRQNGHVVGTFIGKLADTYRTDKSLNKELRECMEAAEHSTNRFFVLEGKICRAAQSTREGAEKCMQEGRVLIEAVPDYFTWLHNNRHWVLAGL